MKLTLYSYKEREKKPHENHHQCARITQGYEKWVELFHSAGAVREEYGVTVLAYGHDKDDDSSVYQVIEIESMERMQEAMSNPELQKMRTDAGVDLDSQKITFLVE